MSMSYYVPKRWYFPIFSNSFPVDKNVSIQENDALINELTELKVLANFSGLNLAEEYLKDMIEKMVKNDIE